MKIYRRWWYRLLVWDKDEALFGVVVFGVVLFALAFAIRASIPPTIALVVMAGAIAGTCAYTAHRALQEFEVWWAWRRAFGCPYGWLHERQIAFGKFMPRFKEISEDQEAVAYLVVASRAGVNTEGAFSQRKAHLARKAGAGGVR